MARFTKMVDMAKTPEEIKEDLAPMKSEPASVGASTPVYPYGLCISLTEEELEKLDLDPAEAEVGATIHLCAMAKVTSKSESERVNADGSKEQCCRIELQITQLGTEAENEAEFSMAQSAARRKTWYGDEKAEGEAA